MENRKAKKTRNIFKVEEYKLKKLFTKYITIIQSIILKYIFIYIIQIN